MNRYRDQHGCVVTGDGQLVALVAPWLLFADEGRAEAMAAYKKRRETENRERETATTTRKRR